MKEDFNKEQNCTCGTPENCKCKTEQVNEVSTVSGGGCGCGGSCGG